MRQLVAFFMFRKKLAVLLLTLAGSLGAVPIVLGGYEVIEAVDSTAFCTQVCHDVHYAEAVTFKASPHAEVTCAECHVGSGTKNLLSSKLRGLKDILPAITSDYERPIATPISEMRPSSETCERCHWSEKFFGDAVQVKASYALDETNTRSTSTRILKVGGGKAEVAAGIHWHSTARVWYLPLDEKRLVIGWVGSENPDGSMTEYIDPNRIDGITPERVQSEKRLMDCMDCHNRTTHLVRSPDELVDLAIADGSIDASLPFIKREAIRALDPPNESLKKAYAVIAGIKEFYATLYPEVLEEKEASIDRTIQKLEEIAELTTLPDGLDWTTHLDNAVHDKPDENMQVNWDAISVVDESPGCFRCHGNLVDRNGTGSHKLEFVSLYPPLDTEDRLDAECSSCHYTLESEPNSPLAPATSHPIDGLDDCLACHNPTAARPFETDHPWSTNEACNTCHQAAPKLKTLPSASPPPDANEITHPIEKLDECLTCHGPGEVSPMSEEHPWATDDTCTACHKSATSLKPIPVVQPPDSPDITHSIAGLDACLVCHGPSAAMPFSADHPWSTDETCTSCHKVAPVVFQPTPQGSLPSAKDVTHSTNGLGDCTSCHRPTVSHTWASLCSTCHKSNPVVVSPSPPPVASAIPHPTTGLGDCLSCHSATGPRPFLADHEGRSNSLCMSCHQGTSTSAAAPSAPASLNATAQNAGQVNLTWTDNSTNETGFRIDRATNFGFSVNLITVNLSANVSNYSDSTVSGSTIYYYRVYAFNSAGNSTASNVASVTTPASNATVPGAPTGLNASAASATQVNLSWTDNSGNETGFRIDRATNSSFSANLVGVNTAAGATSYSDTTVSGGTTYYYRVYAFNSAGSSTASNTASVTTPAPTIDAAALYATYCASCHGANRQGGSASALTPTSLSGRTLTQIINAINNGVGSMPGYSSALTSQQAAALADFIKNTPTTAAPNAPTSLNVAAQNAGQVNLTWADNSSNETGFRIDRATNSSFSVNLITVNLSANVSSYSDNAVSGSTTYYYRVYAFNSAGNSTASNTASVTTPASNATVPTAPTGLNASAASATQVNLSWTDNSSNETGFRIDRATNSTFSANLVTANISAGVTNSSDSTVSSSTTYYYRVFAFNSAGNSTPSNTASVTTPAPTIDAAALYATYCASCHGANRQGGSASALTSSALSGRTLSQVISVITNGTSGMPGYSSTLSSAQISALAEFLKGTPPSAPTSLNVAAQNAGQVNLTWTDNSSNETGFRIDRATNSSFSANLVGVNTAAGATSYSDTTVSGGTTYYYRVFAFNSAGNSTASNTASVTTPAAPSPTAGPEIPHTTNGYTDCLACHTNSLNIRPFPSNHTGRTNDTCTGCHSPSGSTSIPFLSVQKWIDEHALDSAHQNCLSCHDRGQREPFPSSHIGYTNVTCIVCHRAR